MLTALEATNLLTACSMIGALFCARPIISCKAGARLMMPAAKEQCGEALPHDGIGHATGRSQRVSQEPAKALLQTALSPRRGGLEMPSNLQRLHVLPRNAGRCCFYLWENRYAPSLYERPCKKASTAHLQREGSDGSTGPPEEAAYAALWAHSYVACLVSSLLFPGCRIYHESITCLRVTIYSQ